MPSATLKTAQNPLYLIGAVLLFAGSFEFFLHRLPRRPYVEAHADKPRPKPAEAPPPAPTAAPVIVAAPQPAKRAPRPEPAAAPFPSEPAAAVTAAVAVAIDWREACRTETGILCNHVRRSRVRRCLRGYDDVLLRDCRVALLGPTAETYSP